MHIDDRTLRAPVGAKLSLPRRSSMQGAPAMGLRQGQRDLAGTGS